MNNILQQQALILFERAHRQQAQGELTEAIHLYKRSISLMPTAEAYTYLGWAYGTMSRYDEAIAMCHEAIALDPDYGNPYNDIGSYLLEQKQPAEALPWLEKAVAAKRYDSPHYAHLNMGRAHQKLGCYRSALQAYDAALAHDPTYVLAHQAKYSLIARMS